MYDISDMKVALDTKKLIMLMFECERSMSGGNEDTVVVFSKQYLAETTKTLKSCVLNLIKSCKVYFCIGFVEVKLVLVKVGEHSICTRS